MTLDPEVLRRLARESGALLSEVGVRPEDARWIRQHAEALASLAGGKRRRVSLAETIYRFARRAARTAR